MINQIETAAIKSKKALSYLLAFSVSTALALIGVNQASNAAYNTTKNDDDTKDKKYGIIPNVYATDTEGGGGDGCAGGDSSGCCFPPSTQIQSPTGAIPISQIAVGAIVVAYDDAAKEFTTATVEKELRHGEMGTGHHDFTTAPLLEIQHEQDKLIVTGNHPLYDVTSKTFKPAADFVVGDSLLTQQESVSVTSIKVLNEAEHLAEDNIVYNLTLTAGPHTYIADGIVVHNKDGGDCY
jgi:hypothetical protein